MVRLMELNVRVGNEVIGHLFAWYVKLKVLLLEAHKLLEQLRDLMSCFGGS